MALKRAKAGALSWETLDVHAAGNNWVWILSTKCVSLTPDWMILERLQDP